MLILGIIIGLLIAILIFVILAALSANRFVRTAENAIRERAKQIDEKLGGRLPIQKGFIDIPPDDDEIARQEIIESNKAAGKATPIADLK